jgi:SpoVK/Ycf46/Vps4 family AAA+-type ATPase
MARADLLKRMFQSYQQRDDHGFRAAAEEIIEDERKKHHIVVANELERLLTNGSTAGAPPRSLKALEPPPLDADRRTPLPEVRRPERYLDDLVLSSEIRATVERVAREFAGWEILETHGLEPVRRILFCGPSGCGKSATAEALAAELGLPLLYVRFDAVVSSLLGETAVNLRRVFDYARRGQWVMLFDEFDAIGRSRDDVTEHGEIKRVVNSFLQIMDGFEGRSLIIAATNFEQALDPAIWRRFDEVVRFGRPDPEALSRLVSKRLCPLSYSERQATTIVEAVRGGTFADAERVCLDIRKLCALRGDPLVRDDDIVDAIRRHEYRQSVMRQATANGAPSVDNA